MYGLGIQKILNKVDALKNYDDKISLLKEAVSIADVHNDVEWAFELRKQIMEEEYYTPHFNHSYEAINWMIGIQEQEPDLITNDDFLWEYKWVFKEVNCDCNITKDMQDAVEKDFKNRLQSSGYSLRGYYDILLDDTIFLGKKEESKKLLALRNAESTDDMSNCSACECDNEVDYYINFEDIDIALEKAAPILSGKVTCGTVPLRTYSSFLYYYTKHNLLDKAEPFYQKGIEKFSGRDEDSLLVKYIDSFIFYLAKANRQEEALKMLADYYPDLKDSTKSTQFVFFISLIEILRCFTTPEIECKLPDWHSLYNASNKYKVSELIKYYTDDVIETAKKYDQRNGNNDYMNMLKTEYGL